MTTTSEHSVRPFHDLEVTSREFWRRPFEERELAFARQIGRAHV